MTTINYENLGVIAYQIIMKEKQIKNWEAKPVSKKRDNVIETLKEEIEDLKEKMYALV